MSIDTVTHYTTPSTDTYRYLQVKTQLQKDFGYDLVKSVKHQITNMIMHAVENNGSISEQEEKNGKEEEEDEEEI